MQPTLTMPRTTANEGLNIVCDVAARCWDLPRCELTARARLREDLGADSLDILDLLTELEKEFSVSIPDEAAEQIGQLGDVVVFLRSTGR